MRIKNLGIKTLLVALCLCVGSVSAWAETETFGASNSTSKDVAITGTAVNIASGSNPSGTGQYVVFGVSEEKGLKLRTGSALTFNINFGYRITNITVKAYQNNKSSENHDMTCDGFSVDGTTYNFASAKEIPYNKENTSTEPIVISTGKISAISSVAFNFTNTSVKTSQIIAYITVEYETADYSEDFESTTLDAIQSAWINSDNSWPTAESKGTYASRLYLFDNQCGNSTKWLCTASKNDNRQTTAYYYFASAYTDKAYQFNARLNMNMGNNNDGESRLYFMNGAKKRNNEDPDNFLFYIGVNSSGKAYLSNGTDTETSTIGGGITGTENISNTVMGETKNYKSTGWFNAFCTIDFEKGNAKVTLNRNSTTETLTINLKSGTKQLSGLGVRDGAKVGGVVAMDDIALYELTYPAFTLSDTEKEFYVEESETVSLTDITGDISIESDNTDVATVSFSDGTITINGISAGTATITVTGTNDGLTITKTIDVTIGGFDDKYTAAKAPYDTKVASLDAAGQAYWSANVTPAASVTNASGYSAAVTALPTTYVAAVKAQTTGGSDMTDAMPTGNAGWTCNQGNGPASYQATGATETYGASSAFVAGNIMSQTITGLPNGYYKVQFYGVVNAANGVSTVSGSDLVQAYANTTSLDVDVVQQNDCTPTDYLRTIEAQITDGTLTYGLKVKDEVTDAGNWAVAKIYSLTYLGSTKYGYTINAVAGGTTIKELATGSNLWPSETYGTYTPKAILYNGKYYVLDDEENENLDRYYASYTMGAANETREINYTLDESIVGFYEGETTTGNNAAYSNGAYGTVAAQNKRDRGTNAGTLTPGIYQFEGRLVADGNSGRAITLREGANDPMVSLTGNNTTKITFANFKITSTTSTLYINGANSGTEKTNLSTSFDYVLIRKLNVNDDPVVIGDINNSTYYLEAMTDKVTLKPGESYHYQFVNHNNGGSSQWLNYVVPVYTSDDVKTLVIRADNWEDVKGTNTGCTNNITWGDANATFISEMNGATVDMTLSYSTENVFSMSANITTKNYNWTYAYTSDYTGSDISLDGNIKVALSVSNSWLEVLEEGFSTVATTITSAGWATLYTDYALDFENTGLTAYTASYSDSKVTLTEVQNVPAGTGVVLKGDANTYSIPVIASSETAKGQLTGSTTEGLVYSAEAADDYYMLTLNSEGKAQFTKLTSGTIAAGKAYLPIAKAANGARLLSVVFADDATGISSVPAANDGMATDAPVYNLKGQRVSQPQKGLYIVNGKKMVIK